MTMNEKFAIVTDKELTAEQLDQLKEVLEKASLSIGVTLARDPSKETVTEEPTHGTENDDESYINTEGLTPGDLVSVNLDYLYTWIIVVGGPLSAIQFVQSLTGAIKNIKDILKSSEVVIYLNGKKHKVKDGQDLDKLS